MIPRINQRLSAVPALVGSCGAGLLVLACAASSSAQIGATRPALASLAGLPLCFEANSPAQFVARSRDYQFLIHPAEALLVLRKVEGAAPASPIERVKLMTPRAVSTRAVRMQFVGANPQARILGVEELSGKINYLIGGDPAQWHAGVPTFARVQIEELYPGINLVYYGNHQQLEYDFSIAPRADLRGIAIHFDGVDKLTITEEGELVLTLGRDEIRQPKPLLYQVVGGERKAVSGGYRLRNALTVEFQVGRYNHDLPLVIDPTLSCSTYFGGNGGDLALAVKVDANGSIYVAGETLSTAFPFTIPPGGYTSTFQGGTDNGDAFVAKFDQTGTNFVLRYFTYLGGSGNDGALDLAVDSSGNAFVTGFTDSANFPVVSGIYPNISGTRDPNSLAFPVDAFVAELNTNGSALVYSTYLGGSGMDVAGGIAVDPLGNAYVTGYTKSTDFPMKNALQSQLAGVNSAFVTKIAPGGAALIYSTYLGGAVFDEGEGIAADTAGFAYVTGYTASQNFPTTTNGWRTLLNNSTNLTSAYDAFVAKLTPYGTNLVYSTLLGGTNNDAGYRIAVDAGGYAYVAGVSQSPDFPNTATNLAGLNAGANGTNLLNEDAFLTKISSNGATLVYSALFGGAANDIGWGVVIDPAGDALVIGISASTDFPTISTSGFLRSTNSGNYDVFVTAFNPDCSALLYSAFVGGSANDFGYGIAADPAGNAYMVGLTYSADFPTVNAFQPTRSVADDAFIAKILMEPTLTASSSGTNVYLSWRAFAPEFVLESNTNLVSPGSWALVSPAPPPSNGWHTVAVGGTNDELFFRLHKP